VIVKRLVAAAMRHVLPSHPAHGQVVWSGTVSAAQAAAVVQVRLGSASGLQMLVEETGATRTAAEQSSVASAVGARFLRSRSGTTSPVVIILTNGWSRRVPSLQGTSVMRANGTALAGGVFTILGRTGRVTTVDASGLHK